MRLTPEDSAGLMRLNREVGRMVQAKFHGLVDPDEVVATMNLIATQKLASGDWKKLDGNWGCLRNAAHRQAITQANEGMRGEERTAQAKPAGRAPRSTLASAAPGTVITNRSVRSDFRGALSFARNTSLWIREDGFIACAAHLDARARRQAARGSSTVQVFSDSRSWFKLNRTDFEEWQASVGQLPVCDRCAGNG